METRVLFPSVSSLYSTERLFALGVRTGSPLSWWATEIATYTRIPSIVHHPQMPCHKSVTFTFGGDEEEVNEEEEI